MDFEVRIAAAALADFEEILDYSWSRFPSDAEHFGNAILDHMDLLKRFPYIGPPVAGRPDVRRLIHTPIAIYYRVHTVPQLVEILHFRHVSRERPTF